MPLENGLDNRLITSSDLQQYFVNKANGEANAGGIIRFWTDTDRTNPKPVYELVQDVNTLNYSYVPLPNPLTLSGVGTVVDSSNNDIPIYWFPYDGTPDASFNNLELYYVEVLDANSQLQFTREAWPFPLVEGGVTSPVVSSLGVVNQLTNPQFTKVLFKEGSTLTIHLVGNATTNVDIAPGWTLSAQHSASGDISVTQVPISGTQHLPFNPPFTLKVIGNGFVQNLSIYQELKNNPDWAAPSSSSDTIGFLSGSILLAPQTGSIPGTGVEMLYVPNAGNAPQPILSETNNTTQYAQFTNTIKLQAANNPNDGITGSDRIVINFTNPTGISEISNIQVLPLTSDVKGIQFEQTPANRQLDQMFNYYKAGLDFKPIPSYLIGWDFGLNPAQFLGQTAGPFANASNYCFDQTIIFQTAANSFQAINGNDRIKITAQADTQVAIIQYLDAETLASMLANNLSSNIYGYTTKIGGLPITISLWVTTNATLPNMNTNLSLVTGLDLNGFPNVVTGWTEFTRSNIANEKASFMMAQGTQPSDYGFSGWGRDFAAVSTSTFFAIVIGTGALPVGNELNLISASLVPGDIPTRPAPQSVTEVLLECQRYYWKTFPPDVVPANALGSTLGAIAYKIQISGNAAGYAVPVMYPTRMRAIPNPTYYNPRTGGAAGVWFNTTSSSGTGADSGVASPAVPIGQTYASISNQQISASDVAGNVCTIHVTYDARLGIV